MVLRTRIRRGSHAPLSGSALRRALQQFTLSRRAHDVHALLPVVSDKGPAALEVSRWQQFVPGMQVGYRAGVLELLRMVPRAGAARVAAGLGMYIDDAIA